MAEKPKEWDYKHIDSFIKGLNLSVRSDKIDDSELVQANNVVFEEDRVRIDTGYIPFFGNTRGVPRVAYQVFRRSGISELMLITNSTLYRLQLDQWQYVKGLSGTTTTAQLNAGGTNLTVTSIAGFASGDFIGVTLDNGIQHQTTINGAPAGSTIVMADPVPIGRSVPNGASVIEAVVLNGSLDLATSMVMLPFNDWFVFTNGVDNPKRYDGTDCVDIPNLPSSGNVQCRVVTLFNNYLLLMNTIEGGTAFPQRVRRCDTADPTNWTTGNAGFNDIYVSEDFIVAAEALGPYMIIYKDRSITRMEYVGSSEKLFHFEPTISGEGTFSPDGVINLGDIHIMIGNANIYEYSGAYSLEPVGDKIWSRMFGVRGELNPEFKHRSFGFYVEELDEIWIFFPAGAAQLPNKMVRWRQEFDAFSDRNFGRDLVGYGFYLATTARPWSGLVGDWLQQVWKWNAVSVLANSPITLLCDSVSQVFSYDYVEPLDNGNPINYFFETKDFTNPQFLMRTDEIRFRAKGTNILVEYSFDKGQTWNTLGTANQGSGASYEEPQMNFQTLTRRVRFRFSGSSGGMTFEWFTLKYSPESEY